MRTVSLALFLVLGAGLAHAQSLPPQGEVNVTFTATNTNVLKPMPIAGGKEFVVINQSMAAINAAGNPVLNDMGGRCQLTRTGDAGGKPPFEIKGWCTYADKDGDQIFEECAILPNSPRCTLNGGTGKFEGIRADLQITTSPIKSTYDGITQAIGTKKGTYQLSKSL
jgi:hypothetical protein